MMSTPAFDGPADLLLTGGRVHLGAAAEGSAEWVAVRDGRIAGVGHGSPSRDLVASSARVLDVGGGMVVPGFQDAHVHPLHGGMAALTCELHDLPDLAAYEAAIASYAAANPDVPWITGSGWALSV